MSRVLVVAAHPDDEVLGCGATIARHVSEKATVWALIIGQGIGARGKNSKQLKALQKSAFKAHIILGTDKLILGHFPDNELDTVPRLKIIKFIENTIDKFEPDTIYTHSAVDLNVDHQIVSEAVRTATRPMVGQTVTTLSSFEVPSATEWRFGKDGFNPNLFIDVTGHLERKMRALAAYGSEMRTFPHPRSAQYIRSLATVRGGQSGCFAAEAFELVRSVQ